MPPVIEWVWLVVALPLAGFAANGLLSLVQPSAKRAVSAIGVGTVAAAFVVTLAIVRGLAGAHASDPFVVTLWQWIPLGDLRVAVAFQVDQLSAVMLARMTRSSLFETNSVSPATKRRLAVTSKNLILSSTSFAGALRHAM